MKQFLLTAWTEFGHFLPSISMYWWWIIWWILGFPLFSRNWSDFWARVRISVSSESGLSPKPLFELAELTRLTRMLTRYLVNTGSTQIYRLRHLGSQWWYTWVGLLDFALKYSGLSTHNFGLKVPKSLCFRSSSSESHGSHSNLTTVARSTAIFSFFWRKN